MTEVDICVICQDNLANEQSFQLAECKHYFHQRCINSWFRQGNSKCPLCNSCGEGLSQNSHVSAYGGARQSTALEQYSFLKRASKKKDAPANLVKAINRIKNREAKVNELYKEMKSWKEKEIILDGEKLKVKEAVLKYKKISNKYRRCKWQLKRSKASLYAQLNIAPVIIVERKTVD